MASTHLIQGSGGGGGGCFRKGTLVQKELGITAHIEDIKVGDKVLSFDDVGNIQVSTVLEVHYHADVEPLIRVNFWKGYIDITPNHWVLNQYYSFIEVATLTDKDALVDGMGHLRPIKSIEVLPSEPVWNLTVTPNHTFIANDIRVHNGGYKNRFPVVSGAGGGGGGGKGGGGATVAVASRTPVEDPDSLQSTQFVRVLDLVSEGEIEGLVDGLKSVYIDDTPLQRANGGYNFANVKVEGRTGTQNQEYIPGFQAVETEVQVGVEVAYDYPVIRSIITPGVDRVRITVQIPQLTYQDPTNGDLRGTSVGVGVSLNQNGGGWVPARVGIGSYPVVHGAITRPYPGEYIRLFTGDGTNKISRLRLNFTYTGKVPVTAAEKTQRQTGQWFLDAADSKDPTNYKYRVEMGFTDSNEPPTSTTTNINGTVNTVTTWNAITFKVTGAWDLPHIDNWNFRLTYYDENSDGIYNQGVLDASTSIGYGWAGLDVITGKTSSSYQKSYEIPLVGEGPWQIKVYRSTADSTQSNLQNKTFWTSYTEITDTKLTYPNSAMFGITVNAQQFRSIPTRGYDIKGLKIRIPRNYNPLTREYYGIWDGTFKVEWSDNPAWCLYDMLVESRYGLGEYIEESQVDKWALYEIAKYCDELVPDGFGGKEPRFTCNLYLQTQEEAYKLINAMASIFRGMAYWMSGSIVAVQDSPADAVALFTAANVIDGNFSYQGASIKARHTAALVTWGDPKILNKPAIEYVEDAIGISKYGLITTDVIAVGCTSRGQANRIGKWLLLSERLESEVLTFKTGMQGLLVQPGQIIKVSDPTRSGIRMGGRVVTGGLSSIVVDSNITIKKGKYTLTVQMPNGNIETRDLYTAPVYPATSITTNTLVVSGANFSDTPAAQSMWILSKTSSVEAETWRVLSVTETDNSEAEITALLHNPSKYANIEKGLKLETYDAYGLDLTESLSPTGLTVTESLYALTPSTAGIDAIISWVGSAPTYNFQWRRDNGNWISAELVSSSYEIKPAPPGTYSFRLVAVSALGVKSEPVTLDNYYIGNSLLVPPEDIPTVNATYEGKVIWLEWGPVTDLRGATYEVRWGDSWGSGVVFPMGSTRRFKTRGDGDYWVKVVTGNGIYSTNPKGIRIEGSALVDNVIANIDESGTGWLGTREYIHYKNNSEITLSGSALWSSISLLSNVVSPTVVMLGGHAPQGYYTIPDSHIVDIGSPGSCQITSGITYDVYDSVRLFSDIVLLSALPSVLMPIGGSGALGIEVNMAQNDGIYSGWQVFVPGDYYARYYKFRLNLTSNHPNVAPHVYSWTIAVDVPDRIDSQEVITPTSALAVTFVRPFNATPKIQATIQNATPGDDIIVENITSTGMLLTVKNGGASVARTVHYLAQGY